MKFSKLVSENIIPKMCACKFFTANRLLLLSLCAGIAAGVAVTPKKEAFLRISKGTTSKQVAHMLKKEGIISSERFFLFLIRVTGNDRKIKSGIYKFHNKQTELKILSDLARGRSHKIKVTIPEGFTAAEIAVLLDSASICRGEKFLDIVGEKLLEGYLFPDTYFFDIDMSPYLVADVLRDSFNKKFSNDLRKSAVESGLSEKDTVILASLIEKEAKKDEERPLISAVFRNRLKKGWHLESCATIIYALGKHKDRLTYKDTKVNSPYNTYLFPGLPPHPICNPGISSLNAAIFPADTDAMFFVSDGAGSHKFSKYFSEHNVNKKKLNQR